MRLEFFFVGEFLFEVFGDGEVKVVAAKDQVVADSDAVELNFVRCVGRLLGRCFAASVGAFANANEREVGCSAANVTD